MSSGVQRSAEQASLHARFVLPWSAAYVEYFNRNGMVLGDSIPATGAVAQDVEGNSALCGDEMKAHFTNSGIELPGGRGRGAEDLYLYIDSEGGQQQLSICFKHVPDWFTANGAQPVNIMEIRGATTDLARKLDSLVDSNSDSAWGELRNNGPHSTGDTEAWPALLDGDGAAETVQIYYKMPY